MKNCENKKFIPKKEQIDFAEKFLDIDGKRTRKEIAEEIGVHYNTITNWFKNNDFVDWINSQTDKILKDSRPDRYITAIRKAKIGDFNFSKMLFEMQGEYIQKSETRITNIHDSYENKTDEEIIEEFERELSEFKSSRVDRKARQIKEN